MRNLIEGQRATHLKERTQKNKIGERERVRETRRVGGEVGRGREKEREGE